MMIFSYIGASPIFGRADSRARPTIFLPTIFLLTIFLPTVSLPE